MKCNFEFCIKKIMSRILNFSDEVEGIEMSFKDKNIEGNYQISNWQNGKRKTIVFCLICLFCYFLSIAFTIWVDKLHHGHNILILLGGLMFHMILLIISKIFNKSLLMLSIIKYLRFLCLFLTMSSLFIFPINPPDPNSCDYIRLFFSFLFVFNFLAI